MKRPRLVLGIRLENGPTPRPIDNPSSGQVVIKLGELAFTIRLTDLDADR